MRRFILITFIFSVIGIFAQNDNYKILIDGHVIGSDAKQSVPVINAAIHLSTDLGDEIVVYSDTSGYYSFSFLKVAFKQAKISIESNKKTRGIREKYPCYLSSRDFGEIKLPDSINSKKHFIKDFELIRASDCGVPYIPNIIFKNKSLVYDTVFSHQYNEKNDSLLDIPANAFVMYSKILTDNPKIIIQISGHCSFNEKSPFELSQQRAEKVKSEIVKLGIPQERIIAKGLGDSRLLIKPYEITKATTKKEKCLLHAKNRRCVLSVLSWDYGKTPEQLKKEEEAEKTNKEDE